MFEGRKNLGKWFAVGAGLGLAITAGKEALQGLKPDNKDNPTAQTDNPSQDTVSDGVEKVFTSPGDSGYVDSGRIIGAVPKKVESLEENNPVYQENTGTYEHDPSDDPIVPEFETATAAEKLKIENFLTSYLEKKGIGKLDSVTKDNEYEFLAYINSDLIRNSDVKFGTRIRVEDDGSYTFVPPTIYLRPINVSDLSKADSLMDMFWGVYKLEEDYTDGKVSKKQFKDTMWSDYGINAADYN